MSDYNVTIGDGSKNVAIGRNIMAIGDNAMISVDGRDVAIHLDDIDYGEVAFTAYCAAVPNGRTYDDKKIPPWAEITPTIQAAWRAAAAAVLEVF